MALPPNVKPIFELFIAGQPVARPSGRMWSKRPGLRAWMETVAWSAKALAGGRVYLESVELWLSFYTDEPADASNLTKAVEDALNKIVWKDDRQVRALHVVVLPVGPVPSKPGVKIAVYPWRTK